MNDINQAVVSGNLAREPEIRITPSGIQVADLVVATHYKVRSNGRERTTFLRCTFWNKEAEEVKVANPQKGDLIEVTGRLADDNYIPEGQTISTKGRIKLDSCLNFRLISKNKNKSDTEATKE